MDKTKKALTKQFKDTEYSIAASTIYATDRLAEVIYVNVNQTLKGKLGGQYKKDIMTEIIETYKLYPAKVVSLTSALSDWSTKAPNAETSIEVVSKLTGEVQGLLGFDVVASLF